MTAIGSLNKTTATALYCESHHEKQSQTLMLLHGGGLSSKQWQPQAGGLRDFHLLLPDMAEQGKTGGEFELNDATKRIADLIAAQAHGGSSGGPRVEFAKPELVLRRGQALGVPATGCADPASVLTG
jgi:pimeloyl-ACP methyl ester carboxylesterase